MQKKIPALKKKLSGFMSNESGSIKRESIIELSVGGALLVGGISGLPEPVSAHISTVTSPCAPYANVAAINTTVGTLTSINRNGHFNGLGSSTHLSLGHGNYSTACTHTSHGSHGSCGSGCW